MPPTVALCACAIFILWLFAKDAKRRDGISLALWIPLTWAFIISSRPVSLWLSGTYGTEATNGGLQDKLIDKAVFLILIAAGLLVLSKRRANWRSIIGNNKWLFIYFTYLGFSVLWSDDSFTSFKRWIKDAGNVVMVLVILSDKNPLDSVKAFFARYAYLMIPLSVLFIKYYPHLSRHYDKWTNQAVFVGIATDKNSLGMAMFVCGVSLIWMLPALYYARDKSRSALFGHVGLLILTFWLLQKAHSATAVVCTGFAVCLLFGTRIPAIRNQAKHLEAYAAGFAALIVLIQALGIGDLLLKRFSDAIGRDPTLHGRAEIWRGVLKEDINPLIGVGFYSFWSPERNQRLSKDFYYALGTAHNAYIETYLNSGLIGVALLVAVIGAAFKKIKRDVLGGSTVGVLRLTFFICILLYNITESTFDRLGVIWFVLLLVIMEYSLVKRARRMHEQAMGKALEHHSEQLSAGSRTLVAC